MDLTAPDLALLTADILRAQASIDDIAEDATEAGAAAAVPLAKRSAPVLTGELVESIHQEGSALVASAEHARFVHDGTALMPPRPFAMQAIHQVTPDVVEQLQERPVDILIGL